MPRPNYPVTLWQTCESWWQEFALWGRHFQTSSSTRKCFDDLLYTQWGCGMRGSSRKLSTQVVVSESLVWVRVRRANFKHPYAVVNIFLPYMYILLTIHFTLTNYCYRKQHAHSSPVYQQELQFYSLIHQCLRVINESSNTQTHTHTCTNHFSRWNKCSCISALQTLG